MNEFEFINNILSNLAPHNALENDAFVYQDNTVITKDIIIENVHFLNGTRAYDIAKKAIRVNLSDIAAMGAMPYGYFLGLAINNSTSEWLSDFAQGLKEDNNLFKIKLLGGDTAKHTGTTIISITMLGIIQKGQGFTRSGAQINDSLYVSGTIGDSAIGLLTYTDPLLVQFTTLQKHYKLPNPQINLGLELSGNISTCIDISDGLIQDAMNICKSSNVGIEIYRNTIPFAKEVNKIIALDPKYFELAITGGDDYQLLFTSKKDLTAKNITKIGKVTAGKELKLLDTDYNEIKLSKTGYKHF